MLTLKEIQDYKRKLEKELKEVQDWLDTHSKIASQNELEGHEQPHEKTEIIVRHNNSYQHNEARKEDILFTLERIRNGNFGICVNSPQNTPHEIEEERLNANPACKYCCLCLKVLELKAKNNRIR